MAATGVDYARVAFDLIDEFDRLRTADEVMARLSKVLSKFGYTAFLITGVPEPPQRVEPYFLLNGWPESWAKLYGERNYYLDDPVAAWCRRSINPFEWSEAPYDAERCPRAAEVMNVATDFGMKQGFLVPVGAAMDFMPALQWPGAVLTSSRVPSGPSTSSASMRMPRWSRSSVCPRHLGVPR
jgi:LuxR family transcriptional regulator, quorum-sensing system regulator BjaR1